MASVFKDYFSSRSADYAAFRPTYPAALVDALAEVSPANDTALDCGCGAGQLSTMLAQKFARVIAIDASAQQLEHAKPHQRVEYRCVPVEATGLEVASIDLVTAAQAAHWFDLEKFYPEVRRILRPDGVIGLITYGIVKTDGEVGVVLSRFYFEVIGRFWPPERHHVETGYREMAFPFREIPAPAIAMEVSWTAEELLGYVDTWSAVRNAEAALGRAPYDAFALELRKAWGDCAERRRIYWPISIRLGRI
jgi:SAM-dependent methyltransferase